MSEVSKGLDIWLNRITSHYEAIIIRLTTMRVQDFRGKYSLHSCEQNLVLFLLRLRFLK